MDNFTLKKLQKLVDCSPGFLWTYVRLVIPLVVEVDQLTWLPGAIGLDLVRVYLFGNRTTIIKLVVFSIEAEKLLHWRGCLLLQSKA